MTGRTAAGEHAVVIGASMAGLLAARALSDRFERVTIVDRDALPDKAANRRGVPQGRHLHVLLVRGEQILADLFPGLGSELEQAGAIRLDAPGDMLWFHEGGHKLRFESGITLLAMSRPLLEAHVRRRVRGLPNVTSLEEHEVERPLTTPDRRHVTGVAIRRRQAGSEVDTLAADFVVDASGRGSRSPRWLEELGYERPRETAVKIGLGYTTRIYRSDPRLLPDAKAIYAQPEPPQGKRGGGLFPIEGDCWIVTLSGWLGDHAPADDAGFLEFARTLPGGDIYRVISRAEPLTDPVTHSFPANVRHHYELLKTFPGQYLVMGDAICSFNPVYGQGMSVAALEAAALGELFDAGLDGLARRFFSQAAKVIANPWLIAVGEDFRFAGVEGIKPPLTDAINWYLTRVHRTAHHDREAVRTFVQVLTLTRPPTAMFAPSLALRVVQNRLGRRRRELRAAQTAGESTR
jgi:2-polyprenyl-6-methoxyphenol hydroxylase-like FAD-dependent oxidoreductase